MATRLPVPNIDGQIEQLIRALNEVAYAIIAQAMLAAIQEAGLRATMSFTAFLQALSQGIQGIGPDLAAENAEIARAAQAAVLKTFEDNSKKTPTYRTSARRGINIRYAGGILKGFLGSEEFITSSAAGIDMGPIGRMNDVARQWQRLNYGAGNESGSPSTSVSATIGDLDVTVEDSHGPRPEFVLPAGAWIGKAFYPSSELPAGFRISVKKNTPTKGIAAQHWTDAGSQVIVTQIGPALMKLLEKVWADATEKAHSASIGPVVRRAPVPVRLKAG